jgi:hypothetical protein
VSTAHHPAVVIDSSSRNRAAEKSSHQREAFRAVLQRTIVAIPQIKTRGDDFWQGIVADLKEVELQIETSQVLAAQATQQTKEQQNIDSSFLTDVGASPSVTATPRVINESSKA